MPRVMKFATFFFVLCLGFFCLFVVNCKTTSLIISTKPNENITKQIEALTDYREEFIVYPGQVTFIKFPYYGPFEQESLICGGKEISFFSSTNDHAAMAYLAPSYYEENNNFSCHFYFRDDGDEKDSQKLSIGSILWHAYSYPKERLKVSLKKVILSARDQERVRLEEKMLEEIFKEKAKSLLFNAPFNAPLSSKITSLFGTKRIFNNKLATEHLGTDYRAKVGTVIKPANSGLVVYVGDLFFGGNTVIVLHGLSIFTSYSHLSKILVRVGENVTKATVLGYSGMTGRVNGPHLHWGTKIDGNWIDGHSLVEASKKNFDKENSQ